MPEGDFTPHYRPKPLTKAQLRAIEKKFQGASEKIRDIQKQEEKEQDDDVENPHWV